MSDTFIDPSPEQVEAFKGLPRGTPIQMLNLVRFRDIAVYPDGHPLVDENISGLQAYKNYGAATGPLLKKVGGRILWRGGFEATLIGPADETWHAIFIGEYPNADAFFAMITSPEYQKAVVHRKAAVHTSRLLRCAPIDQESTFG
jgi:uncharacterized protein (DUF1330 family)